MTLASFKDWFDPHLERILNEKIAQYQTITDDAVLTNYLEHLKPLALAGGKRGRPYGAWLMYVSAGGQDDEAILPILVALELFHLFALIHDDIIDKGEVRHSVSTIHTYISQQTTPHNGTSQAILLGDLLFNATNQLFLQVEIEEERRRAAYRHFLTMIDSVILGQMIDVDLTTRNKVTWEAIDTKMELKTATYTFVYPLKIGAALARTETTEFTAFCEQFGKTVGVAFQIQDDMLDCLPSTGKTPFRDIEEGQHTYLTQYVQQHGTQEQKDALANAFGKPMTEETQQRMSDIFTQSGAIAHAQEKVDTLFRLASQTLTLSPIASDYLDYWHNLLATLHHRQS